MNRITLTRLIVWRTCAAIAFALVLALPAAAQSVTTSDIQHLQDQVYDASSDLYRMRSTSSDGSARLQSELDDLRDEVVYLKVKLRKEGNVSRSEYIDLQSRIQDLRSRAGGDMRGADRRTDTSTNAGNNGGWHTNSDANGTSTSGTYGSGTGSNSGVNGGIVADRAPTDQGSTSRSSGASAIPAGQEMDVRLISELSSATAQVEQRFEATTVADLYRGNEVLVPAGSTMRGVVSSVQKATRTERKGSVTVAFDQITIRGRSYPMRGTVTQALESEGIKGEVGKIGAGAGIGAIIGGIIGGAKGALLGVLIGGGGTIAATEGKDVTLPADTILRVRLDQPPAIR
jgi:hypothetical protein